MCRMARSSARSRWRARCSPTPRVITGFMSPRNTIATKARLPDDFSGRPRLCEHQWRLPHPECFRQSDLSPRNARHHRRLHQSRPHAGTAGIHRSTNWGDGINNRATEYNELNDHYAKLIVNELLPALEKDYNISKNPDDRAIAGASSGAICAFTVAWQRPDQFHKVISTIGSFTNIRGGHVYPDLIRTKRTANPSASFCRTA